MRNDFTIEKDWLVQPRLNRISSAGKSVRIPLESFFAQEQLFLKLPGKLAIVEPGRIRLR